MPVNSYRTVAPGTSVLPDTPAADYRINPLDVLRISVFGEPELTFQTLPVDPSGQITLPMVGTVQAKGRTAQELSAEISVALRRYLRQPQVAVNVAEFTSQKVTIEGTVKAPGVYQALSDMTLMDAIAMGQGVGDYSKQDEIVVFRRQGDQRYVARFDLTTITRGESPDPRILPGDIVVVGYSASRRFFSDSLAVLPAAVGIFVALIN